MPFQRGFTVFKRLWRFELKRAVFLRARVEVPHVEGPPAMRFGRIKCDGKPSVHQITLIAN
jgi:hypothetical protein